MKAYRVVHTTRYEYGEVVSLCHCQGRLVPRARPGQVLRRSQVSVDPAPTGFVERDDFFGNRALFFSVEGPHDGLEVTCTSEVELHPEPLPDLEASVPWESARLESWGGTADELWEARPFALDSPAVPWPTPWSSTPSRPSPPAARCWPVWPTWWRASTAGSPTAPRPPP